MPWKSWPVRRSAHPKTINKRALIVWLCVPIVEKFVANVKNACAWP